MINSPIINFKNFSFKYKNQNDFTLKNINLQINRGEKVLVVGSSGSGKSTLIKCLNGLIPNNDQGEFDGELLINNQNILSNSIFESSENVATVLQDSNSQFVGLSVNEDVAFYMENECRSHDYMNQKVDELTDFVGLVNQRHQTPFSLSGGEKQLTAIAGVMSNDAPIMVFDEPLAALNPENCLNSMKIIEKLNKQFNKTIILVEHRIEEALSQSMDRIIILDDAEIIADDSPNNIIKSGLLKANGIQEPLFDNALRMFSLESLLTDSVSNLESNQLITNKINNYIEYKNKLVTDELEDESIKFKDVIFKYEDEISLNIKNLSIKQGEFISVLGKNGAGKSTFAKLITGMLKPSSGIIKEFKQDYQLNSLSEIGQKIAYVMQDPNKMIVKETVKDEVAFSLQLDGKEKEYIDEKVIETLKLVDLYEMRNWPIDSLSYGQKKRLTIAAVLVKMPKCIILDEPTAGQDYKHYSDIMEFIKNIQKKLKLTILIITHDIPLAIKYTDRSLVFNDGQIIADGSPDKIIEDGKIVDENGLTQTSLYEMSKIFELNFNNLLNTVIKMKPEEINYEQ